MGLALLARLHGLAQMVDSDCTAWHRWVALMYSHAHETHPGLDCHLGIVVLDCLLLWQHPLKV